MGMSNYNRQNPFMYLLESKQDELVNKSADAVKHMIEMIVISIICIICNIIHSLTYNPSLLTISFIIIYLDIMNFLEIRSCVREIHGKEMNEMIFGDTYKDINLNNEMLLSKINEYNIAIGKVIHANEMNFIYELLYLVIIVCYIILGMIKIFN